MDKVETVARAIAGHYWAKPPWNRLHTDAKNNGWRFMAHVALKAADDYEAAVADAQRRAEESH